MNRSGLHYRKWESHSKFHHHAVWARSVWSPLQYHSPLIKSDMVHKRFHDEKNFSTANQTGSIKNITELYKHHYFHIAYWIMKTDEYSKKYWKHITFGCVIPSMLFSIFGGDRHPLNKVHRSPNVNYVITHIDK